MSLSFEKPENAVMFSHLQHMYIVVSLNQCRHDQETYQSYNCSL